MPLRRWLRWARMSAAVLVVASIALEESNSVSETMRAVLQNVGVACAVPLGLPLAWRALLVLVSLDPDKPRYWRRQNGSAPRS